MDVLIDETYAEDPTQYNFTTFLQTFELTSNATSNATYPFLKNEAVFRLLTLSLADVMMQVMMMQVVMRVVMQVMMMQIVWFSCDRPIATCMSSI